MGRGGEGAGGEGGGEQNEKATDGLVDSREKSKTAAVYANQFSLLGGESATPPQTPFGPWASGPGCREGYCSYR